MPSVFLGKDQIEPAVSDRLGSSFRGPNARPLAEVFILVIKKNVAGINSCCAKKKERKKKERVKVKTIEKNLVSVVQPIHRS